MTLYFHIGPGKTATKSIQDVMPKFGRPHMIRPDWARVLARSTEVTVVESCPIFPPGTIISEEIVGEFSHQPPAEVARRLYEFLGPLVVVWVEREPEERLRSYLGTLIRVGFPAMTLEQFREHQQRAFKKDGTGFFATVDVAALKTTFRQFGHEVRVVDFELIKTDPRTFLEAFCAACDAKAPTVELPHLNATARASRTA